MSDETFKISGTGRHWFSAFMAVREQAAKVDGYALTLKKVRFANLPGTGILFFGEDGAWMAHVNQVLPGQQAPVYAFADTRPDAVRMLIVQLAMEVGWKKPKD